MAELPFILMHPKPDDDEPVIGDRSPNRTVNNTADGKSPAGASGAAELGKNSTTNHNDGAKEDGPNLIQLDGYVR